MISSFYNYSYIQSRYISHGQGPFYAHGQTSTFCIGNSQQQSAFKILIFWVKSNLPLGHIILIFFQRKLVNALLGYIYVRISGVVLAWI